MGSSNYDLTNPPGDSDVHAEHFLTPLSSSASTENEGQDLLWPPLNSLVRSLSHFYPQILVDKIIRASGFSDQVTQLKFAQEVTAL